MRMRAVLAALILLPTPVLALEFSFFGTRPEALNARQLKVQTGVVPGAPVAFDYPDATTAVLRPAAADEQSSVEHPLFRFEWLSRDKSSARFFPLTHAAELERLQRDNVATTATTGAKILQAGIVAAYINKGAVLRDCINPDQPVPDALTFFVTLTPGKPGADAVVLPEGSIAECILTASERGTYPEVKSPITAMMKIELKH